MFRFLLMAAAYVSLFWLIGNLAIKLCGFAPEWSWWFTLMPFCATIPIGIIIASVQRYDATHAQRDFMKRFEGINEQIVSRDTTQHNATHGDYQI